MNDISILDINSFIIDNNLKSEMSSILFEQNLSTEEKYHILCIWRLSMKDWYTATIYNMSLTKSINQIHKETGISYSSIKQTVGATKKAIESFVDKNNPDQINHLYAIHYGDILRMSAAEALDRRQQKQDQDDLEAIKKAPSLYLTLHRISLLFNLPSSTIESLARQGYIRKYKSKAKKFLYSISELTNFISNNRILKENGRIISVIPHKFSTTVKSGRIKINPDLISNNSITKFINNKLRS